MVQVTTPAVKTMTIVKSGAAAIVALVLFAVPAMAQKHGKGNRTAVDPQATADKKAKDVQIEKDYKAALGRIPDQKPADPWGNVRPPVPVKARLSH